MLEAEEVDADFFTPSSSTSLANIFKKGDVIEEVKEIPSLKYVPQLPPNDIIKPEESKPTQTIFACALYAYEWLENTYVSRGKLGFAIMKIVKSGIHNIVLYDGKKTTISNTTVTTNFKINVKENANISYYDNKHKYWSIKATELELQKILEILISIGVAAENSIENYRQQSGHSIEIQNTLQDNFTMKQEHETSDTDSLANKRTKDSILKRMANMGQSVLPASISNSKPSSDSSDSNENLNKNKVIKHKHLKTINSRNNVEKCISKKDFGFSTHIKTAEHNQFIESDVNLCDNNHQIVPFASSNVRHVQDNAGDITSRNDLTILISEQRVSNTELRINMNKITDKLDVVLDKLKDHPTNDTSASPFQNLLIQKLLNEYETKIKRYEDIIKQKGLICNYLESEEPSDEQRNSSKDDKLCIEKDSEILRLREDLTTLTNEQQCRIKEVNNYIEEISQLKKDLDSKNDRIVGLVKKIEDIQKSDDLKNKIKNIMNDTFQAISANFDNEESYSGAKVKSKVAMVIKKTTIEAIGDM